MIKNAISSGHTVNVICLDTAKCLATFDGFLITPRFYSLILKYFFELPNDKPWIVRGWWNDILTVKKNYAKYKSTPLNSSAILWKKGEMMPVWEHVNKHAELIFFTYPSLDNYFTHHWYDPWNEDDGFLRGFPQGDIYSWYKGNVFPDDMEAKKLRKECKVCLFNNSSEINDVEELKSLWSI